MIAVKKTLLSTLAVALLLLGGASRASADDQMKPIIVVSIASYQKILDDIAFVGKLSDNPDIAKNLEGMITLFTQGQGLAGLDKSKPWGLAASTDGLSFQILGFIPVTDLKKLLDALGGLLGDPEKEDGVYKLQAPAMPIPIYLKEKDGYAYLSQDSAGLQNLPKDPTKLLGGLEKKYDLAVRLNIQNIPEVFRQLAIDQIKLGVEGNLEQSPGESDAAYEARSKATQQQMDAMVTMINELDEVVLGWAIDQPGRRTFLDLSMTAVEGSKTAKQMATPPAGPSKFTGFQMKDAVASLHVNSKSDPDNVAQSVAMIRQMKSQIDQQLDDTLGGNDTVKTTVKDVVAEVISVVEDTLKKGNLNGGAVVLGDGPYTLVAGGMVSDGNRLEGVIKKLADLAKSDPNFPADGLKLDVATHKGVKFSTLTVDIPSGDEGAEAIKKLIGDKAIVTVAFGKESAFFAIGAKGMDTIKSVIDKSEGVTQTDNRPFDFVIHLAPILKLMSQQQDANPILASMASALKSSGKDKVQVTLEPIRNGYLTRIEAEEGILQLIGAAAKMVAQQSGVGAF
jgi:hypothetical protein